MEFKEFTGKTVDDALTNATVSLGVTSSEIKYEVIEEGSNGFLGIGSKDAVIKVVISGNEDPKEVAKDFLNGVFEAMQLEVNISMDLEEADNTLSIDLAGPEMGVLIGKRGQTLDSLQYLTNLAVNRSAENYTRVKIDTEDYRRRRKETLENLAKNMASKVKRTKKAVTLEAMNPYERRIIHSALQNDNNVTTHSEGEEPYRYVVITLKK
ncbi:MULTISPECIES: RNA-binding cell elongation regulator Jag/EloR [Pseudobutyrivibrio]|uniref:RNA-binding protein KhpB n=1 Tax=Pseudobutyrivibrio xylanivorans TaxID=185007 RepID=A0A6M0LHL4_PSEXY|nr:MULTISPECIES: RNA-binding cell elongation regulator Jag/EloR [Pseudobutyrivibrio]NEX02058.1 protein jag [Pseudobutyrivibrio xylanivorans]SCY11664.1 spoIIIJ-associated protein [Pseudobutyrivibrio sp. AR14]SFR73982.1 spoIIIJ-associated protein [Pseudobutyrivibrio sp. NOR37]